MQPGPAARRLVPLDDVYIDANFKETQLAGLQPGQQVDDRGRRAAGHAIEGTVDSVAPASGSVFSLLPPDNATGNFTKVVQRVPVRIACRPTSAHEQRAAARPVGRRQRRHRTARRRGPTPAAHATAVDRRLTGSRADGRHDAR